MFPVSRTEWGLFAATPESTSLWYHGVANLCSELAMVAAQEGSFQGKKMAPPDDRLISGRFDATLTYDRFAAFPFLE